MDKPNNMSVKEYLYRVMSVRTNTPEKIITAIVDHQFEGVIEAMEKPGIHSIEISGFGKFLFNTKKSLKKAEMYKKTMDSLRVALADPTLTGNKREIAAKKLSGMENWMEKSKPKFDGTNKNIGGVEESPSTPRGIKDSDSGDLEREDEGL